MLGLLVLKYGFQYFRMGDAAAVSVVMFAMILVVTMVQLWFNRRALTAAIRLLIAVVAAAIFAFPIWFMVTSAFKAEAEVQAIPLAFACRMSSRGSAQFREAAEFAPLWRYFLNSWIYSRPRMSRVTVFFGALAGFGFAKYRFPGRTCPVLLRAVHHDDPVPGAGRAAVHRGEGVRLGEQLSGPHHPRHDERVRRVHDAAIRLRPARRTAGGRRASTAPASSICSCASSLPLLLPALTSLAIIVFIWSWGTFLWPLVIVQDRDLNVLAVGLTNYSQPYQHVPMWGAAMAASTVATMPIACLFMFFQRYFIKGLTAAAVKG